MQQHPYRVSDDGCVYDIAPNDSFTWGEDGCSIGTRQVDCGWLQLAQDIHPCACTSSSCTAAVAATTSATSLDLRYVATEDALREP